jgi:endonuclease YncB( thermonuclease family)
MIKFKHTSKKLGRVTTLIVKGLKSQLRLQEYYSTGKLSRSFAGTISKGKNLVLDITSSKHYWRVVNDPRVAFSVNKQNIIRWMNKKGIDKKAFGGIYARLKQKIYANKKANGKEDYRYWTYGNSLQRSNFAGITAKEYSKKVVEELAPSIGRDVADMISSQIRLNK